jgi:hypothetical protein
MNGPHIPNSLAESQAEADSQPPDLADQRCVAYHNRHATHRPSQWVRPLSSNKAVTPAFISIAAMHNRPQPSECLIGVTQFNVPQCGKSADLAGLGRFW